MTTPTDPVREALAAAITALQWHYDEGYKHEPTDFPRQRDAKALRQLRAALSHPAVEPVAWRHEITEPDGRIMVMHSSSADNPWSHWLASYKSKYQYKGRPLGYIDQPISPPQPTQQAAQKIAEIGDRIDRKLADFGKSEADPELLEEAGITFTAVAQQTPTTICGTGIAQQAAGFPYRATLLFDDETRVVEGWCVPDSLQQAAPAVQALAWPKARDVGRIDDMGLGHLRVVLDSDNDVIVEVVAGVRIAAVEFCNPGGGGGGQSRRTRMALVALMSAIEADNAELPQRQWPPAAGRWQQEKKE